MPRPERGRQRLTAGSLDQLRHLQRQARKHAPPAATPAAPPAPATAAPVAQAREEDRALFRRVVQSVHPLPASNRALLPPRPLGTPAQLAARRQHASGAPATMKPAVSDHFVAATQQHDNTRYLRAGQSPPVLKALRQGKWPVGASLDLHGATLEEARLRLNRFLHSCREHAMRCVRVVHGKGHGSAANLPVLKDTVRGWLSQVPEVQAYVECEERDGGAGAVLVLLESPS